MRAVRNDAGMTLAEVVVILALATLLATITATFSLTWVGQERMRSGIYKTHTYLNLARVEAVNRNRACRFEVDTDSGWIRVLDLNDPAIGTDDVELDAFELHESISFDRPDAGSAVTLHNSAGNVYEVTFSADGLVDTGTSTGGKIHLASRGRYSRISLYLAGGTQIEHWDGSSWAAAGS